MRLAIGSFIEEYTNKVRVIQLNETTDELELVTQVDHPYPTTKIMWMPDFEDQYQNDLFATTGDYLRLWSVNTQNQATMACMLNNNKSSEFCAPLTSFDWNESDPNIIGTSAIDTTCTIWDVETTKPVATTKISGEVKTQLIAHDQEVRICCEFVS